MITQKIIIEKGFPHVWNLGTLTMFYQTKDLGLQRYKPHHLLYDSENKNWFFRGRGHTISEFKNVEELEELMNVYVRRYEN